MVTLKVMGTEPVRLSIEDEPTRKLDAKPAIVVKENDYNALRNKPSIEGVELIGDKSFEELNLQRITNTELENMLTL